MSRQRTLNRKLQLLCAVALSLFFAAANAVPILSSDFVTVDGRQWAQPDLFTNLSWNDINAQCPGGVCGAGSMLNGLEVQGLAWASIDDVGELFAFVSPHPGGIALYLEVNSDWAPSFFDVRGFRDTVLTSGGRSVVALTSSLSSSTGGRSGVLSDNFASNVSDRVGTTGLTFTSLESSTFGGWFYRVPEPATITLVGLALCGVGWRRRRTS